MSVTSTAAPEASPLRRLFPLLVVVWALTVRIGYLGGIEQSPSYDVKYQAGADQYDYFIDALKIHDGDLVGSGLFNRSPLYPYFLALIFSATGGGNLLFARLGQALFGVLLAWLVYRLGERAGGRGAGLAAGLIFGSYGPMLMYEVIFLRDALLGLLYLGTVMLMIRTRERPTLPYGLATGVVFMLSYLAKPNILVMVLALPWWLGQIYKTAGAAAPSSPRAGLRPALLVAAGFVLGLALAFSPLFARNLAAGVPAFATTQRGALEFIAGNHPAVSPAGWSQPPEVEKIDADCRQRMGCAVVAVLSLYRDNPWALVERQGQKLRLFFSGYEIPSNLNYYVEQRYTPFLALPWLNWSALIGLALPGLWLGRKKWRELFELYAYVLLFSAGTVAFYIVDRFRLPLAPALAVFAGVAVDRVIADLRRRRFRTAAIVIAAAVAIAALSWPRPRSWFETTVYHNLVRHHLMKNEPDRARAWYNEGRAEAVVLATKYNDADAHFRLAYLMYLGGDPLPAVVAEMEKARSRSPSPALARQIEIAIHYTQSRMNGPDPKVGGYRLK